MQPSYSVKIIAQVMTPVPTVIGPDIPIARALQVMSKSGIRHLPVVVGNRVVGILTDRNAKAAALSKWGASFDVKDVMMPDPYVVRPDASLDKVLTQMMKNKYGSTVVQEKSGAISGIFTTVDALYLLRRLLKPVKKKTRGRVRRTGSAPEFSVPSDLALV